jgi:voltage-gated potassium channel
MFKQWNKIILFFIFLALVHLVLETTPSISSKYQTLLLLFDGLITLVFVVDFYFKLRKILIEYSKSKKIAVFFRFELLIDFLSIIPFFISLLFQGFKFITVLRLLRMLRILKLLNVAKSHSLIINAVKNKRHELYISMQVVIIITIILSAILYFVENPSQPDKFSSITDAFLWSISKFIGEIGGYGDFAPITVSGKILATFVGILGIAIFAVPAGIISSGFVEEIEQVKTNDELDEIYTTLTKAFQFDILAGKRAKESVGLLHVRRRFISLVDASVKLNKREALFFDVCALNRNLKLNKRLKPSGDEEILIEYFENNSLYGTFVNRNSSITIISPHSNDGFNHGHYTYCLAEYLQANYISIEKYGMYSFFEENNINFSLNDFYLKNSDDIENEVFNSFISDVKQTVKQGGFVFNIGSSMGKSPSFHLLSGSIKGEVGINKNGTFMNVKAAEEILANLSSTSNAVGLEVTTHSHYGNSENNHIDKFMSSNLNANSMSIKVNIELMKGSPEKYYESIGVLGNAIKNACL